jgi:hypothetical protein
VFRLLATVIIGATAGPAAAQQAAAAAPQAPAAAPQGPTVAETLVLLNQTLAAKPSPWRPCASAPKVELSPEGLLTFTVERAGYCEHSQARAWAQDLDPTLVAIEAGDEAVLVLGCRDGLECARLFQKRKVRGPKGWELKDKDWNPRNPAGQPHIVTELRVPLANDPRATALVADGFRHLLRAAAGTPDYGPQNPFVAQAAAAPPAPAAGP